MKHRLHDGSVVDGDTMTQECARNLMACPACAGRVMVGHPQPQPTVIKCDSCGFMVRRLQSSPGHLSVTAWGAAPEVAEPPALASLALGDTLSQELARALERCPGCGTTLECNRKVNLERGPHGWLVRSWRCEVCAFAASGGGGALTVTSMGVYTGMGANAAAPAPGGSGGGPGQAPDGWMRVKWSDTIGGNAAGAESGGDGSAQRWVDPSVRSGEMPALMVRAAARATRRLPLDEILRLSDEIADQAGLKPLAGGGGGGGGGGVARLSVAESQRHHDAATWRHGSLDDLVELVGREMASEPRLDPRGLHWRLLREVQAIGDRYRSNPEEVADGREQFSAAYLDCAVAFMAGGSVNSAMRHALERWRRLGLDQRSILELAQDERSALDAEIAGVIRRELREWGDARWPREEPKPRTWPGGGE